MPAFSRFPWKDWRGLIREGMAQCLSKNVGQVRGGPVIDKAQRRKYLTPAFRTLRNGRLAQLDRALASGAKGQAFESPIARQEKQYLRIQDSDSGYSQNWYMIRS